MKSVADNKLMVGRAFRARRWVWCVGAVVLLAFLLLAEALHAQTPAANGATNSPAATGTNLAPYTQSRAEEIHQRWLLSGLIIILLGIGAVYLLRKQPPAKE